MPEEDPLLIPVATQGDDEMALFDSLHEQNMAQLGQTGIIAQNNFVTMSKAQDYDYIEQKRLVSLEEAVGIREVSSKQVPAGPTAWPSGTQT